jgi:DNA polymerase III sliding clamp (beta) subunit (PCNA family)
MMTGPILRAIFPKQGMNSKSHEMKVRFTPDYMVFKCQETILYVKLEDIKEDNFNSMITEDNITAKVFNMYELFDMDDI